MKYIVSSVLLIVILNFIFSIIYQRRFLPDNVEIAGFSKVEALSSFKDNKDSETNEINEDVIQSDNEGNKIEEDFDGTFNGFGIRYDDTAFHSSVQCVGDTFGEHAWIHRSCQFRQLCFDMVEKEYVLFQSPQEKKLQERLKDNEFATISSNMNVSVSLGGVNPKWTEASIPILKWFPKVVSDELMEGHYQISDNMVMLPFHSFAAFNPGHLMWDDFLPIYTLLSIFNLLEGKQVLPIRYVPKVGRLWATCDTRDTNKQRCNVMFNKFIPLLGIDSAAFTSNEEFKFILKNNTQQRSKYICSKYGAAGMGMLTDHGRKEHGHEKKSYESMHNHGRGAELYSFRNYMMNNMGIPVNAMKKKPYIITFSINSSNLSTRKHSFRKEIIAIREEFPEVKIQEFQMHKLSVEEQIQITSESAIYITAAGGGAVTSLFAPMGSSVILFYNVDGGIQGNTKTGLPARLDWDLFNNNAYMRVHWIPLIKFRSEEQIPLLVDVVRHDLDIIASLE